MAHIVAVDFESTGLLKPTPPQPGIVEIGACKGEITDEGIKYPSADPLSLLIHPECLFEEDAQKITGINPSEVSHAPTLPEVFSEIANYFFAVDYLVTFNGSNFDLPLLQYNLERYGLQYRFPWPLRHFDLMEIATPYLNLPGKQAAKPPKLMELYTALFQEGFTNHHRAFSDADATMRCAIEMVRKEWIPI